MTNDQREAIEILKEIQESNRAWLKDTKEENCEKMYLRDIEAIETVLSLLKEQNKKIETTITNYKDLIDDVSGIAKELGLEEDATIDEIYIAIRILKQKDKQIDLMIEYIDKEDVSETFCNEKTACDENCTSCIKQYFIELAKEKGE